MIDALLLPLLTQPRVTFSPPPTARIAKVYRYLGIRKDVDPTVVVRVGHPQPPVRPRPGQTVVAYWTCVEQVDGTAVVVIDRDTGRKEIARALIEALD